MVRKVTDKMIIDILKNRDMQKDPVVPSSEIVERFSNITGASTVGRKLKQLEIKELVKHKKAGSLSVYWLPEDFEKRKKKFQINIGWE